MLNYRRAECIKGYPFWLRRLCCMGVNHNHIPYVQAILNVPPDLADTVNNEQIWPLTYLESSQSERRLSYHLHPE